MTMSHLPAPVPYERWEGETAALAEAAEAGRQAAAWVRSLPGPPIPSPLGSWLAGELPDAVEAVMGSLDPEDCDRMGSDGRLIDGTGGADAGTMETLAAVACKVPEACWFTPDQHVRLLAVTSAVTGAVQLLVDDPGTAIRYGLLARQCAAITHAVTRTD